MQRIMLHSRQAARVEAMRSRASSHAMVRGQAPALNTATQACGLARHGTKAASKYGAERASTSAHGWFADGGSVDSFSVVSQCQSRSCSPQPVATVRSRRSKAPADSACPDYAPRGSQGRTSAIAAEAFTSTKARQPVNGPPVKSTPAPQPAHHRLAWARRLARKGHAHERLALYPTPQNLQAKLNIGLATIAAQMRIVDPGRLITVARQPG